MSVGKYAGYNPQESRKAISSGRIPAGRQNEVLLGSNQSGIFSLQQTTALLEKYSHDGELIWQQSIKIPAIEDLFDRLFEENRSRINRDDFLRLEYCLMNLIFERSTKIKIIINSIPAMDNSRVAVGTINFEFSTKRTLNREDVISSVDDHEQLQEAVRSMQLPKTWPALNRFPNRVSSAEVSVPGYE